MNKEKVYDKFGEIWSEGAGKKYDKFGEELNVAEPVKQFFTEMPQRTIEGIKEGSGIPGAIRNVSGELGKEVYPPEMKPIDKDVAKTSDLLDTIGLVTTGPVGAIAGAVTGGVLGATGLGELAGKGIDWVADMAEPLKKAVSIDITPEQQAQLITLGKQGKLPIGIPDNSKKLSILQMENLGMGITPEQTEQAKYNITKYVKLLPAIAGYIPGLKVAEEVKKPRGAIAGVDMPEGAITTAMADERTPKRNIFNAPKVDTIMTGEGLLSRDLAMLQVAPTVGGKPVIKKYISNTNKEIANAIDQLEIPLQERVSKGPVESEVVHPKSEVKYNKDYIGKKIGEFRKEFETIPYNNGKPFFGDVEFADTTSAINKYMKDATKTGSTPQGKKVISDFYEDLNMFIEKSGRMGKRKDGNVVSVNDMAQLKTDLVKKFNEMNMSENKPSDLERATIKTVLKNLDDLEVKNIPPQYKQDMKKFSALSKVDDLLEYNKPDKIRKALVNDPDLALSISSYVSEMSDIQPILERALYEDLKKSMDKPGGFKRNDFINAANDWITIFEGHAGTVPGRVLPLDTMKALKVLRNRAEFVNKLDEAVKSNPKTYSEQIMGNLWNAGLVPTAMNTADYLRARGITDLGLPSTTKAIGLPMVGISTAGAIADQPTKDELIYKNLEDKFARKWEKLTNKKKEK